MKSNKTGSASINEYIAAFPAETQKRLEQVRAMIKSAAPEAREKISYHMPTFDLNGRNLIHFAGWQHHISIYPIPSGTESFNSEISKYVDGKGTLKFPLDQPLPLKLIGQAIQYRVADHLKNTGTSYGSRK